MLDYNYAVIIDLAKYPIISFMVLSAFINLVAVISVRPEERNQAFSFIGIMNVVKDLVIAWWVYTIPLAVYANMHDFIATVILGLLSFAYLVLRVSFLNVFRHIYMRR